jgi:hypothetical protein
MSYRGDIALESTLDLKFTTRRFTTGAPHAWAGSPAVACYVDNGTTEITAGITLTNDFDGRTGLHNVRIAATAANGYTAATNVDVVVTSGTVDSVSIVGEVVGSFSIANRSSLRPTTAGRTLDVSAAGEAGIDWANIGSPTTAVNLSGTNIDTDQVVASVSGAVGSVTGAVGSVTGNVGGNVTGSVGSIATGGITTASFAAGAINAAAIGADAITDAKVASDVTIASVTGAVGSVTGAVGSVTGNVGGNVTGSVGSVAAGGIDSASFAAGAINAAAIAADAITDAKVASDVTIASVTGAVGSVTGAVGSVTGNVGGNVTGSVGSVATGGIAAASFAAGAIDAAAIASNAITAAKIATDAIDADALAADAVTEIQNGLATASALTTVGSNVTTIKATTDLLGVMIELAPGSPTYYRFKTGAVEMTWEVASAGHGAGTTGEALAAAGAAGDPWITSLPGAYGAGTAGFILGTNLNATVSSRATQTSVDTIDGIVDSILVDTAEIGTAGVGLTNLGDTRIANLDATVSSRASAANLSTVAGYIDTEVASIKTVTDLVQTMIELGTGSPTYYRFTAGAVELAPTGGSAPSAATIADAVWDELLSGHAISGSTGEALSAAGAAGDPWITALPGAYSSGQAGFSVGTNLNATVSSRLASASYTAPLDAAATRSAVGLASANLDTQLADLPTNAELATALGTADDAVLTAIDALPTNAELATALGTADDAVLAAIAALTIPTTAQIADKILDRSLAGGSDDTGVEARSVRSALRALRNKSAIVAGTLTVRAEDDTTAAWTAAVTTTAGDPLSAIDPT